MREKEAREEIVDKGGLLRKLYLTLELGKELKGYNVVADEISIKSSLVPLLEPLLGKIKQLIPLLEREMPEWAVKLARETFDNRTGFVIWEKPEILEKLFSK